MDPPLATVLDPDALDRLVASMSGRPDGPADAITFAYAGFEVTVDGDRQVSVTEGRA